MVPFEPVAFSRLSYELHQERVNAALNRARMYDLHPARKARLSARRRTGLAGVLATLVSAFLPLAR